jgi:hypothetical protein
VTTDETSEFNGQTIEAQFFCKERDLSPDWEGPRASEGATNYDRSGAILAKMEEQLRSTS